MNKRYYFVNFVYIVFFAACFVFSSCKDPVNTPGYNNPNAGPRELDFSHDSGLHDASFNLTLTALAGNTIYYSTDGSNPSPGKVDNKTVFKYTSPISVQNRNGQANVLATRANAEQMYPHPDDPRGSIPAAYYPSANQVPKATVIRAIAVDSRGNQSGIVTKTYFIGNNLTNYGGQRVISLVTDPYNLVSEEKGILVRGKASNRWGDYNFNRRGTDWERETYLELFEGNSRSAASLSTGVGIRVRGGWSRAVGQKSFNVYFREEYGINNLKNYTLIPGAVTSNGSPIGTYKSIMLRNGGNDTEYTKFYDVFVQDLLSDRSFSTQAAVPAVVYVNGEYWGFYNLQERYSDNHAEYKYGVNRNNVISYDNGELDDGNAGEEQLLFAAMNTMTTQGNYAAFCAAFDIQNFIDYWAGQIYVYNEDWPQNNYRIWRTRTVEPGNPYGDTRWRYQMFDTEFAMGIYSGGGITSSDMDAFNKILNGDSKDHFHNQLFAALLTNDDFCRQFVNTMMDLYNVNFHLDTALPKLNAYAATYRPLMDGYFERWGRPWNSVFDDKVQESRNYLTNIRAAMTNTYLPKYFSRIGVDAGKLSNVTISTTGVSGASVKINTVAPKSGGSWTGQYYAGIPVTVTASAPPSGYEFDQWVVTGGSAVSPSALTTLVNLTGNAAITANYKLSTTPAIPVTGITLNRNSLDLRIGGTFTLTASVSPANATYRTVFWASDNPLVTVASNGRVTAAGSGTAVITATTAEGTIEAKCTVTVEAPTFVQFLDLASILQGMSSGSIANWNSISDNWEKFSSMSFNGSPITANGSSSQVTYEIVNENGTNKLEVKNYDLGTLGLLIQGITFQTGDTIEIKGTFKDYYDAASWFIVNTDYWGWIPLQGWGQGLGDFQKTFTLTQEDFTQENAFRNDAIKISTGGIEPYYGNIGRVVSTFVLEQVKVTGYRYDY